MCSIYCCRSHGFQLEMNPEIHKVQHIRFSIISSQIVHAQHIYTSNLFVVHMFRLKPSTAQLLNIIFMTGFYGTSQT